MKNYFTVLGLLVLIITFVSPAVNALLTPTPEEKTQFNSGRNATTLASGQIVVGNSSGYAEKQTMSGDMTISNAGVTTIGASAIGSSEITNDSILNADVNSAAAINFSKLENLTSGNLIVGSSSNVPTSTTISGNISVSNTGVASIVNQTSNGIGPIALAVASYDVLVNGGSGAYNLGVVLPANSIILQSWFYIDRPFTNQPGGTIALSCEDANNIFSAAEITAYSSGHIISGVSNMGIVSSMGTGIGADCNITATAGGEDSTDGKLTVYVLFGVHN